MSVPATRCARCVAGQCGHVMCKPGGSYQMRVTDVAGTSCCQDCAGVLLELVLHPSAALLKFGSTGEAVFSADIVREAGSY